ncbi:hypothetical protein D1BOALGB6SA_5961 [Olavius sp. associated proteobacterium Delta 1]|nr:hypothetical protein D1BOALGB6SA_5961 [Olavius sp. associated proteobacterium Delta 1]
MKLLFARLLRWFVKNHVSEKEVIKHFWEQYEAYTLKSARDQIGAYQKKMVEASLVRTLCDYLDIKPRKLNED